MSEAVVYDAGMLIGLADRKRGCYVKHTAIVEIVRPVIPGPVLSQVWRNAPSARRTLDWYLKDCTVFTSYTVEHYKRAGVMLGDVSLVGKKRPDVVDALVALTAAVHGISTILTSDPDDIHAYIDTLPKSPVQVVPV